MPQRHSPFACWPPIPAHRLQCAPASEGSCVLPPDQAPTQPATRMTQKQQLKTRVRTRMARTGESYTAALRHVTNTPGTSHGAAAASTGGTQPADALVIDHGYTLRGGQHPE